MAIKAFIDDSGIGQIPVYCLAGFSAQEDVWRSFTADWTEALAEEPAISYFKYTEAYSGEGEFAYIRRELREYKVREMAKVIAKYANLKSIYFISCFLIDGHWKQILAKYGAELNKSPYEVMSEDILAHLYDFYLKDKLNTKIDVIFDSQPEKEDLIISSWQEFLSKLSSRSRDLVGLAPVFANDKTNPPLQAADLIAGYMRRCGIAGINGRKPPAPPWEIENEDRGGYIAFITPESFYRY